MSKSCEICGDTDNYCGECGTCHSCLDDASVAQEIKIKRLKECLGWALEYIDAIPSDAAAQFPAMPGFDRDYVNCVLSGIRTEEVD